MHRSTENRLSGEILVGVNDRTLYMFGKDKDTTSNRYRHPRPPV